MFKLTFKAISSEKKNITIKYCYISNQILKSGAEFTKPS